MVMMKEVQKQIEIYQARATSRRSADDGSVGGNHLNAVVQVV